MALPAANDQSRLIIAIDYGTTFTGMAWKVIPFNTNVVNPTTVEFLTDWQPNYAEPKVPSVISYSPSRGHYSNWGDSVDPQALKMSWTKLQLDEQSRSQELEWILDALQNMKISMESLGQKKRMPPYPANSPVDVVSDYLMKIREVVVKFLRGKYGAVFDNLPKELVVTIPAQWSDEAKNQTFRAFNKAGFNKRYFKNLEGMYLISEPEAAALYCAKVLMPRDEYEAEDFLAPGDCFVQADLGGGTVDCISYMVTETKPSMKLRQVGEATTAKCGATFIDLEFIKLLGRKLGPEYFMILSDGRPVESFSANSAFGEGISAVLKQFDDEMKKDYDGHAEPTKLTLPGDLYELTNPDRGIIDGEITITNDDMRRVFEFSLNTTMELISAQTNQIQIYGHPTKRIFLSGGFSENQYVRDAVEEFGQIMNIRVNWPEKPTVAVVRGAVVRRIEDHGQGILMTECPKSYGICVSQPFSPYLHDPIDKYRDPYDNQDKARNQMLWLKHKGDLILSNRPAITSSQLVRKFGTNDPRAFITDIVEYSDAIQGVDPQHRMQRFLAIPSARRRVIPLRYDLSDIPKNMLQAPSMPGARNHYCAYLKLRLEISANGQANAAVHFSTRQISTVNINYSIPAPIRTSPATQPVPLASPYLRNGTTYSNGTAR